MKINVLLMCYNSSKMIKEVIKSFYKIGTINVFIDRKTTDNTEEIVRKMGIIPEYFTFIDFDSSRNEIFKKFPYGYRIFIDDSYLFNGNITDFKKELEFCFKKGYDVIGTNIFQNGKWTIYSKITKGDVIYCDKIHEYINKPRQYVMKNGYFEDVMCHLNRTVKRILSYDLNILYEEFYKFPKNERVVYYLVKSFLVLYKFKLCLKRELYYWIIQLSTMPCNYNNFGKEIKFFLLGTKIF